MEEVLPPQTQHGAGFEPTRIRQFTIFLENKVGRLQQLVRIFEGRISGFTMGTGSTLSLLPAQNATGNFVKVVQRLPVRIDVMSVS